MEEFKNNGDYPKWPRRGKHSLDKVLFCYHSLWERSIQEYKQTWAKTLPNGVMGEGEARVTVVKVLLLGRGSAPSIARWSFLIWLLLQQLWKSPGNKWDCGGNDREANLYLMCKRVFQKLELPKNRMANQ